MGARFLVQPNGLLARFSETVDHFTHMNLTPEQAVKAAQEYMGALEASEGVRRGQRRKLKDHGGWEYCLAIIRTVHGENAAQEVRRAGTDPPPPDASLSAYDFGFDFREELDGWSVFTGCDGEDPKFLAFFIDEAEAIRLMTQLTTPDEKGDYDNSGVDVVLAVVTEDFGIVSANDIDIKTHGDLRARIATARAAGLST